MNTQPPAVVLSFGGHAEAYDIVRALGMENIPSVVASPQRYNIASFSRTCVGRIVLPEHNSSDDEQILEELIGYSQGKGVRPVLYYVSDPELSFVRRFRRRLETYFRFLLPSDEILECLFNKVLFSEFAIRHSLPVPPTIVVRNISTLPEILHSIKMPCIVKPAYSEDWVWDTPQQWSRFGPYKKALRRFTSASELTAFCEALPKRETGFVIQSYVDGSEETITSFHGYFDERSNCLGHFVGRKIRTYPPHTGGSTYVQTVHLPEVAEKSIRYLQDIGFRGIVKIDYKWDSVRHRFSLLEINPRYNLWVLVGAHAGVNLSAVAYRHQQGEIVEHCRSYHDDTRLLYFKQDFRAFIDGYRSMGEWTWKSYIQSLLTKKQYRVFLREDPMPFLVSLLRFFKRIVIRVMTLNHRLNEFHKKPANKPKHSDSVEGLVPFPVVNDGVPARPNPRKRRKIPSVIP